MLGKAGCKRRGKNDQKAFFAPGVLPTKRPVGGIDDLAIQVDEALSALGDGRFRGVLVRKLYVRALERPPLLWRDEADLRLPFVAAYFRS